MTEGTSFSTGPHVRLCVQVYQVFQQTGDDDVQRHSISNHDTFLESSRYTIPTLSDIQLRHVQLRVKTENKLEIGAKTWSFKGGLLSAHSELLCFLLEKKGEKKALKKGKRLTSNCCLFSSFIGSVRKPLNCNYRIKY